MISASMALLLLSSCGTTRNSLSLSDMEGEWNIVEINNQPLNIEQGAKQPFIGFDTEAGRSYGNSGCNNLMSSLDKNAKPGSIAFKQMASTMMAGPGMDTERKVLDALAQVKSYRKAGKDEIALCDEGKKIVVKLEKRSYPMTANELEGEWIIAKVYEQPVGGTAEEKPSVTFNIAEKKINGFSGCNRFMGSFELKEEGGKTTLSIPPLAATRMACPDMDTERNILSALGSVKSFAKLKNKNVVLYTAGGVQVMELTKK